MTLSTILLIGLSLLLIRALLEVTALPELWLRFEEWTGFGAPSRVGACSGADRLDLDALSPDF
jgi:hypothetical protein